MSPPLQGRQLRSLEEVRQLPKFSSFPSSSSDSLEQAHTFENQLQAVPRPIQERGVIFPTRPSFNLQQNLFQSLQDTELSDEGHQPRIEVLRVIVPVGQFKVLHRGIALKNTLTEEEKKWEDKATKDFFLDARALNTVEVTVKPSQALWHIPLAKAVKLPRGVPEEYKVEVRFTRNARSGAIRHYFLFHSPSGSSYRTMRQVRSAEGGSP
mmetsp:Transcript_23366/g.59169  ORF Transcript_23366/g.59169 Transcript_23366/m.59169 type:complete len:210 (-) Transcript_23366:297-926(-)